MNAKIENGMLVITIPLQTPTLSSTGKTLTVATTNGFATTAVTVDGKTVKVSVNAYIQRTT